MKLTFWATVFGIAALAALARGAAGWAVFYAVVALGAMIAHTRRSRRELDAERQRQAEADDRLRAIVMRREAAQTRLHYAQREFRDRARRRP